MFERGDNNFSAPLYPESPRESIKYKLLASEWLSPGQRALHHGESLCLVREN